MKLNGAEFALYARRLVQLTTDRYKEVLDRKYVGSSVDSLADSLNSNFSELGLICKVAQSRCKDNQHTYANKHTHTSCSISISYTHQHKFISFFLSLFPFHTHTFPGREGDRRERERDRERDREWYIQCVSGI